jgi:hypothetical protein
LNHDGTTSTTEYWNTEKEGTADERRATQMIIYLRPSAFICGCNTSFISLANLGVLGG